MMKTSTKNIKKKMAKNVKKGGSELYDGVQTEVHALAQSEKPNHLSTCSHGCISELKVMLSKNVISPNT